jgi:hypothetical protein
MSISSVVQIVGDVQEDFVQIVKKLQAVKNILEIHSDSKSAAMIVDACNSELLRTAHERY